MITKGEGGQEYDNFQRLLNEFTKEGQKLIKAKKELVTELTKWLTDEEDHTLQDAAALMERVVGKGFLAQHLELDPEDWVSSEALEALDTLKKLEAACPSCTVQNEELAGQVKFVVKDCTGTLTKERSLFKAKEREPFYQRILAKLRYNRSWQLPSFAKEKKPQSLDDLIEALTRITEFIELRKKGLIKDPTFVKAVAELTERCLALDSVNAQTESQKAKQINTANAKMVHQIDAVLKDYALSSDQKQFFENAVRSINERIRVAAKTNGADFKSCDSAGVSLEDQIKRAEKHCKKK